MDAIAYVESSLNIDAVGDELVDLRKKRLGIEDNSISNRAAYAGMKNPARNLMQHERLLADLHSVARICAALVTHHPACALSENVYEFSLPFITPLRTDDYHRACFRIEQTGSVIRRNEKRPAVAERCVNLPFWARESIWIRTCPSS